ncbi:MAG: group 1 glycosyl transferase [Bacteroidetes bacterium]|nr:MAG: group 1 glycosyl transferase [Bacteroidota bacterium]
MPRVLFIAAHRPDRSPSQRYRIEQYLGFLEKNGFTYEYSWLLSEKDDKLFYTPGNWFAKFLLLLRCARKRRKDVKRAGQFDIIFVQREAFMAGSTWFEKKFSRSGAKLVFDFDDAIWKLDISDANKKLGWLKNPGKTADIIALSHLVIAGNRFLADYARERNKNVVIIPTVIDTEKYRREQVQKQSDRIVIGWTGSLTTIKHFEYAIPILRELKKKYGDRIAVKVIGDGSYINEELGIRGIAWNAKDEVAQLSDISIGIMPLPDDEWTKGKCGLKGLQYMALGIPTLMSPVGINTEIIRDGENGFLPASLDEWVEKISMLIDSEELRTKTGEAGRKTIEEKYSVKAWENELLAQLTKVIR